jgi:hypothetical protein
MGQPAAGEGWGEMTARAVGRAMVGDQRDRKCGETARIAADRAQGRKKTAVGAAFDRCGAGTAKAAGRACHRRTTGGATRLRRRRGCAETSAVGRR